MSDALVACQNCYPSSSDSDEEVIEETPILEYICDMTDSLNPTCRECLPDEEGCNSNEFLACYDCIPTISYTCDNTDAENPVCR